MNSRSIASSLVLIAVTIVLSCTAMAEAPAIVKSCDGCHGKNGVSTKAKVPTIAGISEIVHADALLAYRDGAYPCPKSPMCGISKRLTDEQIEEIAAYYAGLPFEPFQQEADAEKAAHGKEIHAENCEKCHTGGGANPGDDASILAGQPMAYLEMMLADFAADRRQQQKTMQAKLEKLNEEDIEALVHFYGSQE